MDFSSLSWRQRKSTILPLAAWMCVERYGLTLNGIHRGEGQDDNFTYQVEAREGRFLIRLFGPTYETERINSTLWWQSELTRNGLTVPMPVQGVDGRMLQPVPLDRQLGGYHTSVLYGWIDAILLRELRDQPNFGRMMENLGTCVAQLHQLGRKSVDPSLDGIPDRGELGLRQWIHRMEVEDIEKLHPDYDAYERHTKEELLSWAEELLDWLLRQDETEFGVIHGDLNCDNVVFRHEEACLLDFSPLSVGHSAFDLVKALDFAVPDHHHERFLNGYSRIRSLPEDFTESCAILRRTRESVPNWF